MKFSWARIPRVRPIHLDNVVHVWNIKVHRRASSIGSHQHINELHSTLPSLCCAASPSSLAVRRHRLLLCQARNGQRREWGGGLFPIFSDSEVRGNFSPRREMSSSVMEFASSDENHGNNGQLELKPLPSNSDPTALSLSIPREAFLRAALSLKDQVRTHTRISVSFLSNRIYHSVQGNWIFTCPHLLPTGRSFIFLSSKFSFATSFGIGKQEKEKNIGEIFQNLLFISFCSPMFYLFLDQKKNIKVAGRSSVRGLSSRQIFFREMYSCNLFLFILFLVINGRRRTISIFVSVEVMKRGFCSVGMGEGGAGDVAGRRQWRVWSWLDSLHGSAGDRVHLPEVVRGHWKPAGPAAERRHCRSVHRFQAYLL